MKESAKEWIKDIVIAVVIMAVVLFFFKPTTVTGESMEPNFHGGNYLIISKQAYTFGEPKAGDVIVCHSTLTTDNGDEKKLIKRIIGLPGDKIDIKDGKVYINGKEQKEPYIKDGYTNGEIDGLVVPDGEVFCMGDNRLNSNDSRNVAIGCIKIDDLIGKVILRVYPFNEFGLIKNPIK